jgi:hypothetical protein
LQSVQDKLVEYYQMHLVKILVLLFAMNHGKLPRYKDQRVKKQDKEQYFLSYVQKLCSGRTQLRFRENELTAFDFLMFAVHDKALEPLLNQGRAKFTCAGVKNFKEDAYRRLSRSRSVDYEVEEESNIQFVKTPGVLSLLLQGKFDSRSEWEHDALELLSLSTLIRDCLRPFTRVYRHCTFGSGKELLFKEYGKRCFFRGWLPAGFDQEKQFKELFPSKVLFANEIGQTICSDQIMEQRAREVMIMNCTKCSFILSSRVIALSLVNCENCTFVSEKPTALLFVDGLESCHIAGVFSRVTIKSTRNTHFQIYTPTNPLVLARSSLVEKSSGLTYGVINSGPSSPVYLRRNMYSKTLSVWGEKVEDGLQFANLP